MAHAVWAMNAGGMTLVDDAAPFATNGTFTSTAHGLTNGTLVEFRNPTGGGVNVLIADAEYYVRNATTNDFQVSDTPGGQIITFASTGAADVWTAGPELSSLDLRRLKTHDMHPGSADRFGAREGVRPHSTAAVTLSGTTYTVNESLLTIYPRETSTSGAYDVAIERTQGTLNVADGSNPRIDAIDVQVQDDDEDGSLQRRARVVYTAGTPASSPAAPAALEGAFRLTTISVPATGTPAPSLADQGQFDRGPGILPARSSAERPAAGLFEGMYIDQWDTNLLYRYDGSAFVPVASKINYDYVNSLNGGVALTGWTSYTPTWTGIGTATFTNNVGRWWRTGIKTIEFKFWAVVSAAGSGSSNVQVTAPFSLSRVMNQTGGIHVEGSPTPSLRDGLWVSFTTGTGATIDRLRFDNGLGSVSNLVGSDLVASLAITGGGVIMEA